MRLADLIRELDDAQLERLEAAHSDGDEQLSREQVRASLETTLRSYAFVKKFVSDCFPPTFSILEVLLEAEGYAVHASQFREGVDGRTEILVDRVSSGELVGRDSSIRIYRRVLHEARRNDLVLDASETGILGVLRQELGVRQVEHFLIEHHPDFHHFWRKPQAFLDQMTTLRGAGLIFVHEGNLVLPEGVVPLVRKVLGFEMAPANRRRLLERFSSSELAGVLQECGLRTSGSRDERLVRVMDSGSSRF